MKQIKITKSTYIDGEYDVRIRYTAMQSSVVTLTIHELRTLQQECSRVLHEAYERGEIH